jgi:hypothetical protein
MVDESIVPPALEGVKPILAAATKYARVLANPVFSMLT